MRWDENSTVPRPERVSSWKIEPALAPPALNPLPMPRPKRPRPNMVPSSPDSSVLTREGTVLLPLQSVLDSLSSYTQNICSFFPLKGTKFFPSLCYSGQSKVTVDPVLQGSGYSRVLQGQEFATLRGNFVESESDTAEKSTAWPPSVDDERIDAVSGSKRYGSDNWMPSARHEPTYTDLLSGFGTNVDSSHGICQPFVEQTLASANSMRKHSLDQEGKFNLQSWSILPSSLSLSLDSNMKVPTGNASYQAQQHVRYGGFSGYSVHHGHRVEQPQGNWLMPPPPSHFESQANAREVMPKHMSVPKHESVKPNDGSCKLFGIPLITPEPHRNAMNESARHNQALILESDQKLEKSRGSKSVDDLLAASESDKLLQTSQQYVRDVQGKTQGSSTRSCTKVLYIFS